MIICTFHNVIINFDINLRFPNELTKSRKIISFFIEPKLSVICSTF